MGELDSEALDDLLHWIWSWRVQLARLVESTRSQGQGDTEVEQRKSFSRASLDEHLLAVVGGNLVKAVERLCACFPDIPSIDSSALELLRHHYEHWDELRAVHQNPSLPKKQSAKKLADQFPTATPWSVTYTADDWLLGGVVSLRQFTDDLEPVERTALRLKVEHSEGKR